MGANTKKCILKMKKKSGGVKIVFSLYLYLLYMINNNMKLAPVIIKKNLLVKIAINIKLKDKRIPIFRKLNLFIRH